MNIARHSKRLFAALMASTIAVLDVHAAVTDIYSQPLATTSSVVAKPNIMFILDNSGSMANDYMPDDMSNSGKYGFWSPQCNGVAYDSAATVTYAPPLKADGTSYPDANFSAAAPDGYNYVGTNSRSSTSNITVTLGSVTVNIPSGAGGSYVVGDAVAITSNADGSIWMSGDVTDWNPGSKNLVVNVTGKGGSGSFSSWAVSNVANLNNSTYYDYTGAQARMNWTYNASGAVQTGTTFYTQCQSNVGSSPGSGVFTLVTLTGASSAADKQKYANWYAYYRTRRLMTRTATGRAFSGLTNNYRVGFTTISDTGVTQGTNKFVDIGDFDATKKTAFYSSLYTATGNSSTPLRGALSKVGRYFANKAPGQASDPMQYSCQRNYAILSTDGYWNTGTETSSYGPFQLTSNTAVGQQDGGEVKPMHDGEASIVTTVTPTTTVKRNETISSRTDSANWRRYSYPVPATLGGGTCSATQYRIRVQQQNRTESFPYSIDSIDDVTTVVTNTKIVTNGVITSDTNVTTNSSTNVSSTTTAGASTLGAWGNTGGTTNYCLDAGQLAGLGMVPGGTYYSTTGCSGATCTYTATGANGTQTSTNTGAVVPGTPNQLSVISGPTVGTPTVTSSISGGSSNSLADVAEYYYVTDLRTSALSNCTGSVGPDGTTHDVCSNGTMLPVPPLDLATHQHMTTYTIGLGVNGTLAYDQNYLNQTSGAYMQLKNGTINWPIPVATSGGGDARTIDDLWHAAVNGRGKYFATSNANTLSNALQSALSDVTKTVGSAAGAATNSLEPVAGDNNQAYIATYTTVEWTGDVKAYPLDAATGTINTATAAWSAKTQLEALSAGSRNIKYMQPGTKAMRSFTYGNLNTDGFGTNFTNFCSKTPTPLQCATLSSGQVTTANTGDNLVNFLRGDTTYEAETNLSNPLYRERVAVLGDIINASPVYVKKSPLQYTDSGHSSYVGTTATRKAMLYGAANDGMLHAFDASTGSELWAFVPSFVMPNLWKLADTEYRNRHTFFADGTPVVGDIYTGSAWKTILVAGLNSGGRGYYALDITDPDNPAVLWEFTHANMGLTYGNPIITKRANGTWVVAVSSGLNNTAGDGQGHMYLINANTGALDAQLATGAGSTTTPSGLAKINAWVDGGGDNTAKRFYGGDMLGNLWRFDFDDLVAPAGAEATKLATFQITSTAPQPITTKPQLTVVTASGGTKIPVIVVGTGRYFGTSDVSDTTVQSIYAIKDPLSGSGWGDVRTRSDLVNQIVTASSTNGTGTNNAVDWNTQIGWRMDLPQSKERIITDFVLQFNVLSVASAIPGVSECNPSGGAAWLYELNVGTGTSANGTSVSEFLGAYLVVGLTSVKTTDGKMKIEIVGSDASIRTKEPPPPINEAAKVRRSSWRELIN